MGEIHIFSRKLYFTLCKIRQLRSKDFRERFWSVSFYFVSVGQLFLKLANYSQNMTLVAIFWKNSKK